MKMMPRGFNKKPADIRKEMNEAMQKQKPVNSNTLNSKMTPQELFRMNQNKKRGLK